MVMIADVNDLVDVRRLWQWVRDGLTLEMLDCYGPP